MFFARKSSNAVLTHRNRASINAAIVGKNLHQIRFFAPLGPPPMFKRIIVEEDLKKFYPPSISNTKITQQDRAEFLLTNKTQGNEKMPNPLNFFQSLKINENKEMKGDVNYGSSQSDDMQSEEEKEERERQQRRKRMLKGVNISKCIIGLVVICIICKCVYVYFSYGNPLDVLNSFKHVVNYFESWKKFLAEPIREKLLSDPVKPPWHQPKYTVVLEMRNVLVNPEWNYKKGHYFVKRPALDYFLDIVGYPNFELVIYTSENMITAAPVIAQIDARGHRVNHVLFRDCTKWMGGWRWKGGAHVKELSRLNRDLSKVIYIDWDPEAFQLNPENVLRVPKWEGDMNDTYLVDLAELLKTIHLSDVDDVREVLQFYSQFDNPMAEFRRRAQMLNQDSTRMNQQSSGTDAPSSSTQQNEQMKKYQGNLFGARRHAI